MYGSGGDAINAVMGHVVRGGISTGGAGGSEGIIDLGIPDLWMAELGNEKAGHGRGVGMEG